MQGLLLALALGAGALQLGQTLRHALRGVGEDHHNYDPLHAPSNAGSNPLGLGNTSVEVTGRPQARGALVIAPDGAEGYHAILVEVVA